MNDRWTRLLELDRALQQGALSMTELAERLQVNPRTVLRDIKLMRSRFGAPIAFARGVGGYRYTEPYVFSGLVDRRRRLALAVALELCRLHGLEAVAAELEGLAPGLARRARRYLRRAGLIDRA